MHFGCPATPRRIDPAPCAQLCCGPIRSVLTIEYPSARHGSVPVARPSSRSSAASGVRGALRRSPGSNPPSDLARRCSEAIECVSAAACQTAAVGGQSPGCVVDFGCRLQRWVVRTLVLFMSVKPSFSSTESLKRLLTLLGIWEVLLQRYPIGIRRQIRVLDPRPAAGHEALRIVESRPRRIFRRLLVRRRLRRGRIVGVVARLRSRCHRCHRPLLGEIRQARFPPDLLRRRRVRMQRPWLR